MPKTYKCFDCGKSAEASDAKCGNCDGHYIVSRSRVTQRSRSYKQKMDLTIKFDEHGMFDESCIKEKIA